MVLNSFYDWISREFDQFSNSMILRFWKVREKIIYLVEWILTNTLIYSVAGHEVDEIQEELRPIYDEQELSNLVSSLTRMLEHKGT